jgi:hypothetical protein
VREHPVKVAPAPLSWPDGTWRVTTSVPGAVAAIRWLPAARGNGARSPHGLAALLA